MIDASLFQPLDDVADMLSGGTPRKSNQSYWNGSIPWLTPKDMGQWSGVTEAKVSAEAIGNGTRLAPESAIFIAVRGMSLHNEIRVLRPAQAMTFNQDIKAIVAGKGIDPRYLYYVLLSRKPELLDAVEAAGHGTGRLPTDKLKQLLIPRFGSLIEAAIAELFSALDRRIELNRRMNETLEAMARAIFKDWFVDFGPTRAKAEGRDPYLAPEIWDLFPDTLEDDGKPVGWETHPLKDFFEIIGGGTPKTSVPEYWDGDIPWFSVVDTPPKGSVFVVETEKNITERGLDESSARLIPEGTTIISARGTVGNLAMAAQKMTFNQSCYALRANDRTGDHFVYLAAQHMVAQLRSMAHGSVFSTITRQTFDAVSLPMPSGATMKTFESLVGPLFLRIKSNVAEARTLAQTRDLLLPKLMSGEIRLGEAEKAAEAVA